MLLTQQIVSQLCYCLCRIGVSFINTCTNPEKNLYLYISSFDLKCSEALSEMDQNYF
jgi:hypothetical protein